MTARGKNVLKVAAWLTAGIIAVQTVSYLVDKIGGLGLSYLDLDLEHTPFSYASAGATLCTGVALAWLYRLSRRWWMLAAAALVVYLAVDDLLVIHERFGSVWPVVMLPVLAPALACLIAATLWLPREARRLGQIGLGLLALAIVLEAAPVKMIAEVLHVSFAALYVAEVTIEEDAELAGWLLLAASFGAASVSSLVQTWPRRAVPRGL
jgi:hypothetical protein